MNVYLRIHRNSHKTFREKLRLKFIKMNVFMHYEHLLDIYVLNPGSLITNNQAELTLLNDLETFLTPPSIYLKYNWNFHPR